MRRDFFWISAALGAAILLFLNIFIQGNFHRFQSNKHSYFSAELSRENKTFNPLRLTADSTEEKADFSLPLELLGTIIGKTSLAFIHNLDTDKQGVYRLNDFIADNELLTKLKILPMPDSASHKLKGFRIDKVPLGSIIEKAGIKNGDIVYSVEGQKIQSTQDAWRMFNTIKDKSRFEIVLLRDDKPVTLQYEIRN